MRVKLKEKIGKFVWDYFGFPKAGLIAQESIKGIRELSEDLTKNENEPMTKKGPVSPEEIVELYNAKVEEIKQLKKENKELIKMLNRQNKGFAFDLTEDFTGFDKDKLYINDTHTKIELEKGNMWIIVFIPQLNEFIKIKYRAAKQEIFRVKGGE